MIDKSVDDFGRRIGERLNDLKSKLQEAMLKVQGIRRNLEREINNAEQRINTIDAGKFDGLMEILDIIDNIERVIDQLNNIDNINTQPDEIFLEDFIQNKESWYIYP